VSDGLRFGKAEWSSFERGLEREWLLTNGIGGFASGTVTGANSRRYHGLLVAAMKPPVRRHLILSQLHETIIAGEEEYKIHSFSTGDFVMRGYRYQQSFELNPLPVFSWAVGDISVEKTITMVFGKNTVAVVYRIKSGSENITLHIAPLVNFRDYHGNSDKHHMSFSQQAGDDCTCIRPYDGETASGSYGGDAMVKPDDGETLIRLICPGSRYTPWEGCMFEHMYYAVEQERGLYAYEDHYIPGGFSVDVEARSERVVTFIATVENDVEETNGPALIEAEKARQAALIEKAGCSDAFSAVLTRAADQFIAYRQSTGAKTILAGYPWFTDWGRDAMISLCGLTLSTRRYDDAAQILTAYGEYIRYGLLPNMFPDGGEEPGYNTVDAALWYFDAVHNYAEHSGDYSLVKEKLFEAMVRIYTAYKNGTLHKIRMEKDGLISAGDENTQLTWMDAKVDSIVFTPRHGKAVEINALWYNALRILEAFAREFGEDGTEYSVLADKVRESFIKTFWFEEGKYLYDVVNGEHKDEHVRPNQIFAVSLSYPVLTGRMAEYVVEKVWKELYTAYGLRSLSPGSPDYKGQYKGDRFERDSAYHQGTVWAWPTGHFIDAFVRTFGQKPVYRDMAAFFLEPFRDHLRHACIGSISEIFDGDEPLTPRGCFAQAWSVAEVFRAWRKYVEKGV